MSNELKVASEAAKEAEKILLHYFSRRSSLKVESKGKVDRVSNADKESEQKIREILKRNFPDYGIVGEEFGEENAKNEYVWYIDPLCGTISFLHGFPEFGISIGLARGDDILIGVCALPIPKEFFTAEKGKSAFLNDKKITVSKVNMLEDAVFTTDVSSKLALRKEQYMLIQKVGTRAQHVKMPTSAPYTLCSVACGRAEGFFEMNIPPLHRVAGLAIAQEAGAKVTNFKGESLTMEDQHVVATNGLLHAETIRILNSNS